MEQLQISPATVRRMPPPFRLGTAAAPTPPRPALAEREPIASHVSAGDMPTIVQSILDCIQIGAMAVSAGLRVSFANRAAVRECSRHALLRIEDARVAVLALRSEADHARMAKAVEGAHAGHWSLVRLGTGGATLSIAVFPLFPSDRSTGPLALLLFGLNQSQEPLAIQLYAGSCGLTPAETRVLLGLAEGLVPKQIANKHDVLLSTVRTQISSIRDKTGTRRLADLMQALVSLPPIMPRT
jgi:DNA-binding CsgD family transcriptional regulator